MRSVEHNLDVPAPGLEFVYRTSVQVGNPIELGEFPDGARRIIPVSGEGRVEGPLIRGRLLADTVDWQVTRPDGVTVVDARYAIRTDDGVVVEVHNRGIRRGPADVLQRMAAGEVMDPASYYFRTAPQFTAPAGRYAWMNESIFVCSGARTSSGVHLAAWRVI